LEILHPADSEKQIPQGQPGHDKNYTRSQPFWICYQRECNRSTDQIEKYQLTK